MPACFPVRGRRCVNHPALLTEGPRYFDVLITPCRTSMSFSSFLSHTTLSLDLKAFSLCHLHPQPKHSETFLSKPPEIDTKGQWESLLPLTLWPPLRNRAILSPHLYFICLYLYGDNLRSSGKKINNYYTIIIFFVTQIIIILYYNIWFYILSIIFNCEKYVYLFLSSELTRTHTHTHTVCVCMYLCIYIYIYIYMCMYVCIRVCVC